MDGGTTLHPVDADALSALEQARALAGHLELRVGGVATVRQFLGADLIDHMHIVLVPIHLGRGQRLWGLENLEQRFAIEATPSPGAGVIHLVFTRRTAH